MSFFIAPHFIFLRQGFSLRLELTYSARWKAVDPLLHSLSVELTVVYVDAKD